MKSIKDIVTFVHTKPIIMIVSMAFFLTFLLSWAHSTSLGQALPEEKVDAAKEYTMGTLPFLSFPALEGIFAPIAAEISKELGKPVHLRSSGTFEEFMQNLMNQEYDIAHIQPLDYVRIATKVGYIPVAGRNEQLRAVFSVRQDSTIRTLKDLKSKTLGLPPKEAAVSYLARAALRKAGLKFYQDVTVKFFSSHQSCLQQLHIGAIDSCASGLPSLRVYQSQMKVTFRILAKSDPFPQTLFVVHKRLLPREREVIRKTLLTTSLSGVDPELRKLFVPDPTVTRYFVPVDDASYNSVRKFLREMGDEK